MYSFASAGGIYRTIHTIVVNDVRIALKELVLDGIAGAQIAVKFLSDDRRIRSRTITYIEIEFIVDGFLFDKR